MPELPEVETIARGLHPRVRRRRISGVEPHFERVVDLRGGALQSVVGDRIARVRRVGKFVFVELDGGRGIAIHLRMTGRLSVIKTPATNDASKTVPYLRLAIHLDDGRSLAFSDVRKFGRARLVDGDPATALGIGADPLDEKVDEPRLRSMLHGKRTPIKVWLLDQRHLAGIGNIYASEALFHAGIRPSRRAGSLTRKERERLLAAMRFVLRKAIQHRGSSIDDYLDVEGKRGRFQNLLAVYGRVGKVCRRCRTPVRRTVLAQRGTFYCPTCQK